MGRKGQVVYSDLLKQSRKPEGGGGFPTASWLRMKNGPPTLKTVSVGLHS